MIMNGAAEVTTAKHAVGKAFRNKLSRVLQYRQLVLRKDQDQYKYLSKIKSLSKNLAYAKYTSDIESIEMFSNQIDS